MCRAWVHFYSVQSYDECVDPNEELKVNIPLHCCTYLYGLELKALTHLQGAVLIL